MKQTTIALFGASGGVGKSTIAKELSIMISNNKSHNDQPVRTCLIDTSMEFGSQQVFFHVLPKFYIQDWIDEIRTIRKELSDRELTTYYHWEKIEKYLTILPEHNLYLLPSHFTYPEEPSTREEIEFIIHVLKRYFEALIIDTGVHNSSVLCGVASCSDSILHIVTDDHSAIDNTRRMERMLRSNHIPRRNTSLLINQYPKLAGRIHTVREIETLTNLPALGILHYDPSIWKMNNIGIPVYKEPDSDFSKILTLILSQLASPLFQTQKGQPHATL